MKDRISYGYETSPPDNYPLLKQLAKENRKHMTDAEKQLWKELRHNRYGVRFRRQHPIGNYIADFICIQYKLVIEVDGGYHSQIEQLGRDAVRTESIEQLGFKVIRFTNERISHDIKSVLEEIYDYLFENRE